MQVPIDLVRREPDLAWCLDWKHTLTSRLTNGEVVSVVQVPVAEWERHWQATGAPATAAPAAAPSARPEEESPTPA